jgi:hypothetical protein
MATIQAKIYRILSTKGDKVYIGSTILSLNKRMNRHRGEFKDKSKYMSRILFEEYGMNHCFIELIEEVEQEQQFIRERFHIENTANCVNKRMPIHTDEEIKEAKDKSAQYKHDWYLAKKEEDKEAFNKKACENQKKYYQQHKEECLARATEYRNKLDKEVISAKNKAYHEAHKDSDKYKAKNERLKEKVPCEECGAIMMRANLSRHKKHHHSADALRHQAVPES